MLSTTTKRTVQGDPKTDDDASTAIASSPTTVNLTDELQHLSVDEQGKIYEEIHGVNPPRPQEDPQEIQGLLDQLQTRIAKIRVKKAYDRASFMNPTFVQDSFLRLLFLRANEYKVDVAAKNIVEFFELKLQLFGIDALVRRVTWKDLSVNDRYSMESGSFQLFPHIRDNQGRILYFGVYMYYRQKQPDDYLRAIWYMTMQCLYQYPDVSLQGVVGVCYALGMSANQWKTCANREFLSKAPHLKNVLPFWFSAMHVCYDNVLLQPLIQMSAWSFARETRLRFCVHQGSHESVLRALMTYGIPSACIPLTNQGEMKLDRLIAELQYVVDHEVTSDYEENAIKNTIAFPASTDVLVGKGRPFQDWPGNLALANMIDTEYRTMYSQATSKDQKYDITQQVIQRIHQQGGRFLQRVTDSSSNSDTCWQCVDEETARLKVSHIFRAKPRKSSSAGGGPFGFLVPSPKDVDKEEEDHTDSDSASTPLTWDPMALFSGKLFFEVP